MGSGDSPLATKACTESLSLKAAGANIVLGGQLCPQTHFKAAIDTAKTQVYHRSNKKYLFLPPSGNSSPPRSPAEKLGLLRTDPVPEEGEDAAATLITTEVLLQEEQDELRRELAKVEEEIQTLFQVLAVKEKHLAEIKQKLVIGSLQELKQNIGKG
ncbi:Tumor protein D52 [Heterocephalus glaber]|uniref:Tumor protein D52 n=1 Tax=Heterocephalus glaber TaxID=10181 RepID=G5B716_HETGA|nr:Tumor protein D52 [Heterocephalus glaber]